MYKYYGPRQNRLLGNLPVEVQNRIFSQLEWVNLQTGKWLFRPSEVARHVYFPVNCVVTMNYTTMDGKETEIAVIGKEGMVGMSLFMGDGFTNSLSVVQTSGTAWRMPGCIFKQELDKTNELKNLILPYGQYLLTQMSQTAVCNRFHSIYQQYADAC